MVKFHRILGFSLLAFGLSCLNNSQSIAEATHLVRSSQILNCELSLKKFSDRLESFRVRYNQVYYENLYQQIQDLLKRIQSIPSDSSQLDKCENLLRVVRDIVGDHPADLASMPTFVKPSIGNLTRPALETTVSRTSLRRSIHYINADKILKQGDKRKKESKNEEAEDLEAYSLSSSPIPSRKTRNRIASEEFKELE